MLRGIDISNWQNGLDVSAISSQIDFVICKATEGIGFVDKCCDAFVQKCRALGKSWGFYHFARDGAPAKEAAFFLNNTINYFGEGIPVLDWEGDQSVEWVNEFVRVIHDRTGGWPWIYANPWRFNQGGVEPNCMRWSAQYPGITSFEQAEKATPDHCDQTIGAWQFTSSGRVPGYSGNLDLDLFYGDEGAWLAYAWGTRATDVSEPVVLEGDGYRVTIEEV